LIAVSLPGFLIDQRQVLLRRTGRRPLIDKTAGEDPRGGNPHNLKLTLDN
jgi:hypothetical protein